jgi:hypothetical protein
MRTEIVGHRESAPDALEPIIVPVAAYKLDGTEVIEEFSFRPVMPAGAVIRAFRAIQPNGILATAPILDFLSKSLMSEDRERFLEFLDRDDLMIEAQLISDVYQTVTEVWAARPTKPRSGSSSGTSQRKRTSTGAARAAASRSKLSPLSPA